MFYKHTHLLFLSLSLFSNSQILRSNKQTQSQQPCPPPHLPQFSQSQTPPSPPPITTPTPPVVSSSSTQAAWFGSCWPGSRGQVALAQVTQPKRWSQCIFLFLGFRFNQFLFWILFLGFLGLWKFEKGEWEKNWVWVSRHLKIFVL